MSASYGLAPRPEPDPAVVALVAAAVEQLGAVSVVAAEDERLAHQSWRFSGRWWMKPSPLRRERPWARA